jgi:hypothetical protein
MEIEWTDADPSSGARRFVRAVRFARAWTFQVRFRRRTDWETVPTPTRDMWETLLDALERRYPRERASGEDIAAVKKVLAHFRDPPVFDGSNSPQRHQDRAEGYQEDS